MVRENKSCAVAQVNNSGGPLDNQTWQTEWKTKKTKLWKLLLQPAVCMPSLIVQWPAGIFNF